MRKIILAIILLAGFLGGNSLSAKAQQDMGEFSVTEMNQVMTVIAECEARELPDDKAASVISYTAGTSAWVIGETSNGWYKVSYQGKEGFVTKDCITDLQVDKEEGKRPEEENKKTVNLAEAGLDTEMAAMEAESKIFVEEIERQKTEAKRSRIWKAVIAVLVVGIFATGTITTIHESKKRKDSDEDQ